MYEDEICFDNKLFSLSSPSKVRTFFDIIIVFIFHFSYYWYFVIEYEPLGLSEEIALHLFFSIDKQLKSIVFSDKNHMNHI